MLSRNESPKHVPRSPGEVSPGRSPRLVSTFLLRLARPSYLIPFMVTDCKNEHKKHWSCSSATSRCWQWVPDFQELSLQTNPYHLLSRPWTRQLQSNKLWQQNRTDRKPKLRSRPPPKRGRKRQLQSRPQKHREPPKNRAFWRKPKLKRREPSDKDRNQRQNRKQRRTRKPSGSLWSRQQQQQQQRRRSRYQLPVLQKMPLLRRDLPLLFQLPRHQATAARTRGVLRKRWLKQTSIWRG